MRSTVVFIFLGILAAASATSAVYASLAQINSHPFGATILTAIKANLKQSTPIEEITTLLDKILADLKKDRKALQDQYDSTSTTLAGQIEDLKNLVSSTEGAIVSTEQSLENLQSAKTNFQQQLDTAKGSHSTTVELLSNLENEYQNTIPDADKDLEDLSAAISACNKAIAKMETYISATTNSLIQVASSAKAEMMAFSKELERLKPSLAHHGTQFSPLIHELIALTEDPEPSKAEKIKQLLEELLRVLEQTQTEVSVSRESFLDNYSTLKPQYEAKIQSLVGQIKNLQEALIQNGSEITSTQQRLETLKGDLEDAKNSLTGTENELTQVEQAFEQASTKLDKLIEIMERLIEHFANNVVEASDYAVNAANTGTGVPTA